MPPQPDLRRALPALVLSHSLSLDATILTTTGPEGRRGYYLPDDLRKF
jgi:hypothetical protein